MKATTTRLYEETINGVFYRVVRRSNGVVQIFADYPLGQSAGFPECVFSGTIEEARNVWRRLVKHAAVAN